MNYPKKIFHWVNNKEIVSSSGKFFEKIDPTTGKVIVEVSRGNKEDVEEAINLAVKAFEKWSSTPVIERADLLRKAVFIMQEKRDEIAQIVALETGKSFKDALGEVGGAIELGFFYAGEGRRFYGRTTTSAVTNRTAYTVRQPIGVAALIVPANTPIANVTWKAFPALLCGNTAVMKASKDTPFTPLWFAKVLKEAGVPSGVFSVIQGFGEEIGAALVNDERIDLVSFTGSVETGKYIQKMTAERLIKVSLELGGKNALVVCDDADLERACHFAVLSAFSNAGQRCASGSRIIIFDKVYNQFKKMFVSETKKLKLGSNDTDDLGPVINEHQLNKMIEKVKKAESEGAQILIGGNRLEDPKHQNGFYMAPTIIDGVSPKAEISRSELFGPITCFYKAKDFAEVLKLANDSPFGLTAAIHTKSIHRAQVFINKSRVGVVSVNGPTFGSEPHMPFGGLKDSGNGFREPGTEALDFYSEWKTVYIKYDPEKV